MESAEAIVDPKGCGGQSRETAATGVAEGGGAEV